MIKHVFRTLNKSKVLYTGISTVPFRQFSYKPGQQDDLDDEDYDYQLTASDPIKKKSPENPRLLKKMFRQSLVELQIKKKDDAIRNILLRGLKYDGVLLGLKFLAYYLAPFEIQGIFFTEFCRTAINALFHGVQLSANYVPHKGVDYRLNRWRAQTILSLIPGALFVATGVWGAASGFWSLVQFTSVLMYESSINATLFYAAALALDVNLLLKNSTDPVLNKDSKGGATDKFRTTIKNRDPFYQRLLFGNAMAVFSTSTALLCTIISMLFPETSIASLDSTGTVIISGISIALGLNLVRVMNLSLLLGGGVAQTTMAGIQESLKKGLFIETIENPKTIKTGHETFLFNSEISLNLDKMEETFLQEYQQDFKEIAYHPDFRKREEKIKEMVNKSPDRLFQIIQIQLNSAEKQIRQNYREVGRIDLELNHQHLLDDDDGSESLPKLEEVKLETLEEDFGEHIDKFLSKANKQSQSEEQNSNPEVDPSYYSLEVNHNELEEKLQKDENFRFFVMKERLQENPNQIFEDYDG